MGIALAVLLSSVPCHATLGDHERTVEADRTAFHGQPATRTDKGAYKILEIQTDSRQLVREYATPTGTVFAVTWQGARQPDLSQLFGTYYQEYLDQERATPSPPGRAPKVTQSSNVTVVKFGHMGDVRGKAYIPQFMPDGVKAADLR